MRRVMRALNVAVALVTLLSALAVLTSNVFDPGYRAHYRDSIGLVVAYIAAQVVIIVAFVRDSRLVPWIALVKALLSYLFLWTLPAVGPMWIRVTPARYVYQLFDSPLVRFPMFALFWLGRGAWNTFNALYFTADWWRPLRDRQPLFGRVVTIVPIAIIVVCIATFLELVREESKTFSPAAHAVAQAVYASLDCDTIRGRAGTTSDDTRQQGDRRWQVRISYGCPATNVVVRGEDGRFGFSGGPRPECCAR
jgi:hypothetical protein